MNNGINDNITSNAFCCIKGSPFVNNDINA